MAFDVTTWLTSQVDVLTNIARTLEPVQRLITAAAYIMGLGFFFKAIHTLKIYGESKTMSSGTGNLKEPVLYFLVGAMLVYFPTALSTLLMSTFGESTITAYHSVGTSTLFGPSSRVGRPLTMIIQTIGLIAFIRGWVLIARSASQGQPPGGTGKGFIHVFGGILAMNIVKTIEVINNTLYG
jgi:intracellular multiplication protein IcmC